LKNNIYNQKEWVDKFIPKEASDKFHNIRIGKLIDIIPDDVFSILDVGVGAGSMYKALINKTGINFIGLDISLELMQKLKDGNVVVADVTNIPFKANKFDLVIAADVIEHLTKHEIDVSAKEIVNVATKYILINSPYKDSVNWPVSLCNSCKNDAL